MIQQLPFEFKDDGTIDFYEIKKLSQEIYGLKVYKTVGFPGKLCFVAEAEDPYKFYLFGIITAPLLAKHIKI